MTDEMTTEEAVKIINAIIDILKVVDAQPHIKEENKFKPSTYEALEMAIQALEAQPIIPSDATNGDIIKAVFPNAAVYSYEDSFDLYTSMIICPQNSMMSVDRNWWNKPYKAESGE